MAEDETEEDEEPDFYRATLEGYIKNEEGKVRGYKFRINSSPFRDLVGRSVKVHISYAKDIFFQRGGRTNVFRYVPDFLLTYLEGPGDVEKRVIDKIRESNSNFSQEDEHEREIVDESGYSEGPIELEDLDED
ncbi:hypothetical protein COU62_04805 [Candidatus Pacearchaeota archaeon CG10_big_fil_rev_8_21_14_0_10_35_219]|nr:MAG: hypothetical protein COU62_04805 [Candidatus Pacearchaeota archaeon CG10_big_fil_rev_8_21_14_0_10_35_219]